MTHEELIGIQAVRYWYQIPVVSVVYVLTFVLASACTMVWIWVFWAICQVTYSSAIQGAP